MWKRCSPKHACITLLVRLMSAVDVHGSHIPNGAHDGVDLKPKTFNKRISLWCFDITWLSANCLGSMHGQRRWHPFSSVPQIFHVLFVTQWIPVAFNWQLSQMQKWNYILIKMAAPSDSLALSKWRRDRLHQKLWTHYRHQHGCCGIQVFLRHNGPKPTIQTCLCSKFNC